MPKEKTDQTKRCHKQSKAAIVESLHYGSQINRCLRITEMWKEEIRQLHEVLEFLEGLE